jgi:hypothetical protein
VRAKFPPLFEFQRDGFRVAGSPIGTDAFMQDFVDDKIKDAQSVPNQTLTLFCLVNFQKQTVGVSFLNMHPNSIKKNFKLSSMP